MDGEVKSVDIGNNEIGSADVKDNSLNTFDVHSFLGVDVVDNSLTGADVQESSLGKVPSSGNADTLGGQSLAQVKSSIVARIGSDADVFAGDPAVNYPLTSATWTQPAGSVQDGRGQVTLTFPSNAACAASSPTPLFAMTLSIDGGGGGSGPSAFGFTPGTRPLGFVFSGDFAPATAKTHTMTADLFDNCTGQHVQATSMQALVIEHR